MDATRNLHQTAIHLFKKAGKANQSILTLGGTGPNGSTQIAPLSLIGNDYLNELKAINIVSASAFAYFLFLAHRDNKLRRDNYLEYDRLVRQLHGASFWHATCRFSIWKFAKRPLFHIDSIRNTVELLIEKEFACRPLKDFPENLRFWSYCDNHQANILISPKAFPNMQVWQAIAACLSIKFIHGTFEYEGFKFSDPIFSPSFPALRRSFLKTSDNHLYFNFKKTLSSKNVNFVINRQTSMPMVDLFLDFFMFAFNLPNTRINQTHRYTLSMLDDSIRGHSAELLSPPLNSNHV